MPEKFAIDEVEVLGDVVKSYLDALEIVRHIPETILAKHEIGRVDRDGVYSFDITGTDNFGKVLPAMAEFDAAVGLEKMFMQAWAKRFEPRAVVTHIDTRTCRKAGADRCRYEVTWR